MGIWPALLLALWKKSLSGELLSAQLPSIKSIAIDIAYVYWSVDLNRVVLCALVTSIPAFSKAILRLLDIDMGQPRLPLSPFTVDVLEALRNDLAKIGFFDWAVHK